MFFGRVTLFRLFGFTVRMDASWLLLAALIVWSLAVGFFPQRYPGLSTGTYWWMGVAGAIGILFSIVFHEMSHSLVARRFNMPIHGITLFVFGGVAEMQDEPTSPRGEFLMAVAGPISSLVLAGVLYVVTVLATAAGVPVAVVGVLTWLSLLNVILAVFNLIPAFPLDGGRMLRAALWGWKGDLVWASSIAARTGAIFGIVLMALAFLEVLGGNFVGGMWWFLIGLFVRGAAQMAFSQTMTRQVLQGAPVRQFMQRDPVVVPPDLTLNALVENYIYNYHFRSFPVMDGDRLLGIVTLQDVRKAPQEEWGRLTVRDIMEGISEQRIVGPNVDALDALKKMRETGIGKLMVVEHGRLMGILTLRDMLHYLAVRLEMDYGQPDSDSALMGRP